MKRGNSFANFKNRGILVKKTIKKIQVNKLILDWFKNKKIRSIFLFLVFTLSSSAFADLYLNSITGSIYLNTSNIARMQIISRGDLVFRCLP